MLLGAGLAGRAQETALIIRSEPGDPIGGGQQLSLTPPDWSLFAGFTGYGDFWVSAGGPDFGNWTFYLAMPWYGGPRTGVYTMHSDADPNAPDQPRFYVARDGGYGKFDGTFEIRKVIFGDDGIAAIWVLFDLRVPGKTGSFRGEFRLNRDSQAASVNQTPYVYGVVPGTAEAGRPFTIAAHPTDDGLPAGGTLQWTWEILNGLAAHATLADPSAPETTLTLDAPGDYWLGFRVTDGEKTRDGAYQINVPTLTARNVFQLSGPPDLLKTTGPVQATNLFVQTNYAELPEQEYYWFIAEDKYWDVALSHVDGKIPPPGRYDARAGGVGSGLQVKDLATPKFEVRPGSIAGSRLAGALWVTFPIYGLPEDSIGLGEFRYNIPPELAVGAPPIVDAGQDRDLTSKSRLRLLGAAQAISGASDAPLHTAWSLVSGPAAVTFADATAVETDVVFTAPGAYVFRLTATQDAASASDEVTINYSDRETSVSLRDFHSPDPGRVTYLTPADYDIYIVSFTGAALKVQCSPRHESHFDPNAYFVLSFSRQGAQPFTVGDYVDDDNGHDGMFVDQTGAYGARQGVFTISELEVDAGGALAALRLSFLQYTIDGLGNREPPVQGELRWHADVSKIPPNRAPRVAAGLPKYLSAGRTFTYMTALVDDDGLPVANRMTFQWTKVSGPGNPVFAGIEPSTRVDFPGPGTYVLRYTASDGALTTSDEVTVVVGTGTQTYRGYLEINHVIFGSLQVTVLASGRFTASLLAGGVKTALVGSFVNGQFSRSVPGANGPITFQLEQSPTNRTISGTFSQGGNVITLAAEQTADPFLRTTKQSSPYAGAYTWQTDLPAPGEGPLGHNYGTARVLPGGSCVIAGHLADGRAVSYGGWTGLDGVVPLIVMFGKTETFAGPVQFLSVPDHGFSLGASLQWYRKADPKDPRFPAGFAMVCRLAGARYTAPTPLLNLLTLEKRNVDVKILSFAASWGTPRPDARTLRPRGVVTGAGAGFLLVTDPRTGLFGGTVLDPQKKARHFGGAFLQGFGVGEGSFLSDHESGVVEVQAVPP
ncbi:MAG TPA: hypothetical protein VGO11_27975 [Chthoniobacteraceae bacterium]|nr:hypothetical protein [Chthoniobacteraceae bacterium]